jgi:hypothetical protein
MKRDEGLLKKTLSENANFKRESKKVEIKV